MIARLDDFDPAAPGYGWHLVADFGGCNPQWIDDRDNLAAWVDQLVKVLGMEAYGDPLIHTFAHDDPVTAGYSVVQLITTSSITAHLSPFRRSAHVDAFSCRRYEPFDVIDHTERAFGADPQKTRTAFLGRG